MHSRNDTQTVEEWILTRLTINQERPDLNPTDREKQMILKTGELFTLADCIQHVKISEKHDEIAAEFKKCVRLMPEGEFKSLLQFTGLYALKKLEAEKNGKVVDWEDFGSKCAHEKFVQREIKRVWG